MGQVRCPSERASAYVRLSLPVVVHMSSLSICFYREPSLLETYSRRAAFFYGILLASVRLVPDYSSFSLSLKSLLQLTDRLRFLEGRHEEELYDREGVYVQGTGGTFSRSTLNCVMQSVVENVHSFPTCQGVRMEFQRTFSICFSAVRTLRLAAAKVSGSALYYDVRQHRAKEHS